jgi:hypothetical protein
MRKTLKRASPRQLERVSESTPPPVTLRRGKSGKDVITLCTSRRIRAGAVFKG